MIDLHAHTNESDGTLTPAELVEAAAGLGIEALGVCDHDTFAGYDACEGPARAAGLDLVCGIELSTKLPRGPGERNASVHMLGYFLDGPPAANFRAWLERLQSSRRDRNRRLAERLQTLGLDIRLEEVVQLGRSLAGRPHFAKLMLQKGYIGTIQEAFDRYLAESAEAYVEREEPSVQEGIERISQAGGLASLAHPVRLSRRPERIEELVRRFRDMGLRAIEVYHSDHDEAGTELYLGLARQYGLAVTGGTDFHGGTKPGLALGTGYANVSVPRRVLDELRAAASGRSYGLAPG